MHKQTEPAEYWQNKTVLVTGGSRGIGAAIARGFAAKGAKVAINFTANETSALEVKNSCPDPERVRIYKADVGSESDVVGMFNKIAEELGPVSILVNNAGITRDKLVMMMSSEDFDRVIKTHLYGTFYCTKAALNQMLSERFGRIINISSVSSFTGNAGQANYAAAKAGINAFSRAVAREMGRKKINCVSLVLGAIETEMMTEVDPQVQMGYKNATALRRFGQPEEVANYCVFLASAEAAYATGQTIVFDGGMI